MDKPNVNGDAMPVDYDPFAGQKIARAVPTTEPQRELWLAAQLSNEASLAYNESVSLNIKGALCVSALQDALLKLTDRHDALRSTISADGLSLFVGQNGDLRAQEVDLSGLDEQDRLEALSRLRIEAVEKPFDLLNGPLVQATLVQLGETEHELILTAHHIICDGWSFGVIAKELMALYASSMAVEGAVALSPAYNFSDHAREQSDLEHRQAADADTRWWVERFSGPIPVLELPADRPRQALRSFASRREDLPIAAPLVDGIRKLGSKQGVSLFVTLFTAFGAMLSRLSGQGDVVVGVPAAGQAAEGKHALVGQCVQLLPIRMTFDIEQPFDALLEKTSGEVLDAWEHQACTFGTLLKKLQVQRDPGRLPLVSVLFNLDTSIRSEELSVAGLAVHLTSNPRHFENFDIFLNASQIDGGIVLECQYNTDLFDAATVRRWLALYRTSLERLTIDSTLPTASTLAPTNEDLALLTDFNRTDVEFQRHLRIEDLIARQVAETPESVAVISGNRRLTYRQLDARANALATLLKERGVKARELIGLCCGRNEHMLVGLVGILKAGAGYIPMDPALPADRLDYMCTDAKTRYIVSDRSVEGPWKFKTAEPILLDDIGEQETSIAPGGGAEDVAFVIYTSGSTGRPKGVRVPHRSVVNLLESARKEPGMEARNVVLSVTTLSFDIAVSEVILPLTVGASVVVASRAQATDGTRLRELIESESVNFIDATPSTWRLLLAAQWRGGSHVKAICTGEPLPPELGRELLPCVGELWNGYGPTETTVWSSFHRVLEVSGPVSIGHPIANTQIHVVDARLRPVPVGVVGELLIGGEGVTMGYLGRPDLTEERFLPDPFRTTEGAFCYKTGDLGRLRANGVLECLGRMDYQVKIRGYRIELGEIEATLLRHPGVERAVLVTREDVPGDVRLVAYVVSRGALLDEGALREFLRLTLPEYMIPFHVMQLGAIPLLPNGKIDRKALPAPNSLGKPKADFVAPRSELERQVLAEMEASLRLPGISVNDDFFSLGGHSLLAAQLTSRLNVKFKSQLSMRHLFEAPTAARLAELITVGASSKGKPVSRRVDRTTAPLTTMQERMWFLEQLYPGRVTYNGPSAHRLSGALDEHAFQRAFGEMMLRQPSLRTSFEQVGNQAIQRIHPNVLVVLFPAEDITVFPADDREQILRTRLEELTAQTFDLSQAPLFKAHVFKMSEKQHVLFFMAHHIIWDGWSFDLLYSELSALYAAFSSGMPSPLQALAVDYGDFAVWHCDWVRSDDFAKQLEFWRRRLDEIAVARELPTDMPRRTGMAGAGNTEWVVVDRNVTDSLHRLARNLDTTLFIVMMSLYGVLLHALSRQRQLVIGTPVRGRNSVELEAIMGFFNTLLPLPVQIDSGETFEALVARVKSITVESLKHPDVPLEQLTKELAAKRGNVGAELYQALFSFQDGRQRITNWGGLLHENILLFQRGATEDLGMWFVETKTGLHGGLTYNTDVFASGTVRILRDAYLLMIGRVTASSMLTIDEIVASLKVELPYLENRAIAHRDETHIAPIDRRLSPDADSLPTTETEKLLASIWSGLLKLSSVGRHDNFFDLGGGSLLAVQAIIAMEEKTGKRVDRSRFIFETLGQIAKSYDDVAQEPSKKSGGLRNLIAGMLASRKS